MKPFELADEPLALDGAAMVVGAPDTGVADGQGFLWAEECALLGRVNLIEFRWHFDDAYRTTCPDTFGGSPGSPLHSSDPSADAHMIYALINTTVEAGTACYLGVPCEVAADAGVRVNPGHSYATPIDGLGHCFNAGRFVLAAACPLAPLDQFELDGVPAPSQPPAEWNTTLSGSSAFYRYNVGEVGTVDCRSDTGYSGPIRLADALGEAEGFFLLCVLGGPTPIGGFRVAFADLSDRGLDRDRYDGADRGHRVVDPGISGPLRGPAGVCRSGVLKLRAEVGSRRNFD